MMKYGQNGDSDRQTVSNMQISQRHRFYTYGVFFVAFFCVLNYACPGKYVW